MEFFEKLISNEVLYSAVYLTVKGKDDNKYAQLLKLDIDNKVNELRTMLCDKTFVPSKFLRFVKKGKKKDRKISAQKMFPDAVLNQALKLVVSPVVMKKLTKRTYSCIKGRGIKSCADYLKSIIQDEEITRWCLKFDIRHFYESIDHEILLFKLREIFGNDEEFMFVLESIVRSHKGVPLGTPLSPIFADVMLCDFDKFVMRKKKHKRYARYADDVVVFAKTKEELNNLLVDIKKQFCELNLCLKGNEQIFPVSENRYDKIGRGVDIVGVVFHHKQTRMRKSIKKSFAKKVKHLENCEDVKKYKNSLSSWYGWSLMTDARHLRKCIGLRNFEK